MSPRRKLRVSKRARVGMSRDVPDAEIALCRNVPVPKRPCAEMSPCRKGPMPKRSGVEMSICRNVCGAEQCTCRNVPVMKSLRRNDSCRNVPCRKSLQAISYICTCIYLGISACSRDSRPRDWSRLGSILLVSVSPIISRDSRH